MKHRSGKPGFVLVVVAILLLPFLALAGAGTAAAVPSDHFAWPVTGHTPANDVAWHQAHEHGSRAVDIGADINTEVGAAQSGVVSVASSGCPNSGNVTCGRGFGNYVVVRHDRAGVSNPLYTLYGHLHSSLAVSVGTTVTTGQTLGRIALSGNTDGPHTHFAISTCASVWWGSSCTVWNAPDTISQAVLKGGTIPGTYAQLVGSGSSPTGSNARSDVDKNGGSDLVIVTQEPNGSAGFALLSTYQGFISPQLWWDGSGYGWSGVTPLVGDVNGDQKADYVYLTNEGVNGTKAFVATAGTNGFNPPQLWWNGVGWGYTGIKASLGDVDGNKGEDLVLTTAESNGAAGFVLLSTYGTFLAPQRWWDGTSWGWSGITPMVGDVNGDKKADYVLLTNEGTSGTNAFIAISSGSGFGAPQLWWHGVGWGYNGIKPSLGDADGNGGADLVLTTQESGGRAAGYVLLSTYQGFFAPHLWWDGSQFGWSGVTPFVGDINGDRKADYVYLTDEGAGGTKAFVATAGTNGFNPPQLWWNGAGWWYGGIKAYLM